MPTSLLIAPAAHGKTAHALERIRAARASDLLAPIAVVLPNHIQLTAFQNRLAAQGGALGVSLFTFYRLYAELLARVGEPLPQLDGPAQIRLIRALTDDLALTYFAPLRDKPGFAAALREAFEELKRARIFPEDFTKAARGLGPRLEELAAIYSAYQHWLQEKNWADPEGLGWLAAIALEKKPNIGSDLRLLIVDGFDEFNPTQLAVLKYLAPRARETLITLTGDPQRNRLAHRRFHRAEKQLRDALAPEIVEGVTGDESRVTETLRDLEHNLFEPSPLSPVGKVPTGEGSGEGVSFLEAQTRAVEARAALRWIKQRIVEDNYALSDVAIVARSLDPYRAFLEETAREFGLPLRIVGGAPLAESPVVNSLLALLSLPAEPDAWRPRSVLAALHSPYFDWSAVGLDVAHTAVLDSVARLCRVVGGLDQWREALTQMAALRAESPDDEPEAAVSRPTPESAAAARAAFETLVSRLTPPSHAPLRAYIAFVEDLIGGDPSSHSVRAAPVAVPSLNILARALAEPSTADRDLSALRAFKEVLRGLALTESLIHSLPPLGEGRLNNGGVRAEWDYSSFLTVLRESIETSTSQTLTANANSNSVFVSSVLDARGLSFRAVALLGLAEGEFPQPEREMPLLRESDRAALRDRNVQIEPRLRGDEVTIFYEAVTRARERLLLCRPYLADDGQQWEASAYWRQLHQLCGEPKSITVRPEDRLPPEQIGSTAEWIEHGYDPASTERGVAALKARLAAEASGLHEGELPDLSALIAARYAPDQSWSASRLEAYGTCGFYFYAAYVLKLEPREEPEEGYDVRALGSMYHAILERVYRDAPDPANLDALLDRLPAAADSVFQTAPADYGFRPTALWAQQQSELVRVLRDTVAALAEQSEGWTPRHFEQRFGFGEPPLVVHTDEGDPSTLLSVAEPALSLSKGQAVRVHGYIDRIDVNAENRLRIVDYKASGSPITANDLKDGHRLQLPLYALAARDALNLGEIADGFYWHIGRAKASSLKLEKFEGGVPGAFETAKVHVAAHVRGIRSGQFQPRPPDKGCPSYCPAVGFCWRYKSRSF
ncbi:MAG TPA: PD-(D/E)XK nuclease family protein [Anaerolineales bacterium]|nr:PD-(D/E)XK nuclease family protein [Anaerolineales bacterium]